MLTMINYYGQHDHHGQWSSWSPWPSPALSPSSSSPSRPIFSGINSLLGGGGSGGGIGDLLASGLGLFNLENIGKY